MGRVLVVDDEEDVRVLIRTNLLVKGHEVIEAETGEAALAEAKSGNLDLVILDIMMPGMDGFEVLDSLRSAPETESLPVLMLTAKSSEEDRVNGLVKGAHDYLSKPFFTTELLLRIDRILNTKATADSLRQISMTDPVTGVNNRRYFELRLEQLCDKARTDDSDLVAFVIDIQGTHDAARRNGWRPVDKVLAGLGMCLKEELKEGEEAFWLGSGFVVLDPTIASASNARTRLDELKRKVSEVADVTRKEIPLSLYYGYAFREKHDSADDFFNQMGQAPYKSGAVVAPTEEARRSQEEGIERAFGGKLTGLAPVEPDSEDREKAKRERAEKKKGKKISTGTLQRELREVASIAASTEHPAPASAAPAKPPGRTTDPLGTRTPRVRTLGGPLELHSFLESECAKAVTEQFDIAIIAIDIQGIDEAVAHSGKEAVDNTLGPITLEVAAMAADDETIFWTGRQLMFIARSSGVAETRHRLEELCRAYTDRLAPHKAKIRLDAAGGYAYYDFEEPIDKLIDKASKSPFRGGLPITPLEARQRNASAPNGP